MAGRYNHWLRTKLAERIRNNGGYYDQHAKHILVWMCRVYDVGIKDVEDAVRGLVDAGHFLSEADLTLQAPDYAQSIAEYLDYDSARECLHAAVCDSLQDALVNDHVYRMWSPETARRYGFDYKGDGADAPFNMTFRCVSSGGKRVSLTVFEGVPLSGYSGDFADSVAPEQEDSGRASFRPSNAWCRKLMGMMDELDTLLSRAAVMAEARHIALGLLADVLREEAA